MAIYLVLLGLVCLLLAVLHVRFWWQHRRILVIAKSLPCPSTWPLIGNALIFSGDISGVIQNLIKLTTHFRDTYCLWLGPEPLFVVSQPSDVQIVLNNSGTLEKDLIYEFLKPFGGDGLITCNVALWKKYRPLVNPILHPANVKLFFPVFNDVSKELARKLIERNDYIDPLDYIFNATFDAVFGTIIPLEGTSMRIKEETKLLLHECGVLFSRRMFKAWLYFDLVFKTMYRKEIDKAMEGRNRSMRLLEKVLEGIHRVFDSGSDFIASHEGKPLKYVGGRAKNLFEVYMENPPDGSDPHEWKDEFFTFMAASTDTTAATLPLFLTTLANLPDVQAKVRAEINSVLGDSDRDVTMDDINAMTYLGQAIMESMRLHGSVPVLLRTATKDTQLTTCMLPAGSRIMVPLQAMGWNTDLFPEPEKYLPERFSPENTKGRHGYSFIPFSRGPRNCVGKTYSLMLMKTAAVYILRNCKVRSSVRLDEIEYQLKTVIFSKTPLLLKFEVDKM